MKVFLWRVARWCLSTRGKLIRKTMECPIYCSFCVECDENDWHIFVGCEQVAKVWQEASLKHQVDDTREFIFTALQQFSYPKIEVFVFAMWTFVNVDYVLCLNNYFMCSINFLSTYTFSKFWNSLLETFLHHNFLNMQNCRFSKM